MAAVSIKSANKYSRSLFELCAPSDLDVVCGQLLTTPEVFAPKSELVQTLENPRYSLLEKIAAVDVILAKIKVTDYRVINLLKLLTESRRLSML